MTIARWIASAGGRASIAGSADHRSARRLRPPPLLGGTGDAMGKVIAAAAYTGGRKVADITIQESGQWAAKPGHFVWIGIHQPNELELRELQAQFQLHDLAIEDALHAHQRPK